MGLDVEAHAPQSPHSPAPGRLAVCRLGGPVSAGDRSRPVRAFHPRDEREQLVAALAALIEERGYERPPRRSSRAAPAWT